MKIQKANYTQIPNSILDNMSVLSDPELRILLAICRKTIGYHKDTDQIVHNQMQKMTGLSVNGIKSGRESLKEKGLIDFHTEGIGRATRTFYDIIMSSDDIIKNNISHGDIKDGNNISHGDIKDGNNISHGDTTKESNINKDCYEKNIPYMPLAKLLYEEHKKHDDKFLAGTDIDTTLFRWANDIRLLSEVDKRTLDEIRLVILWCQSPGCFWISNILSGKKLREKFPTLIVQMNNGKNYSNKKQYEKDWSEKYKGIKGRGID